MKGKGPGADLGDGVRVIVRVIDRVKGNKWQGETVNRQSEFGVLLPWG